jgi:carboxypeptidase PM20D1
MPALQLFLMAIAAAVLGTAAVLVYNARPRGRRSGPVTPLSGLQINTARAAENLSRYIQLDTSAPPGIRPEEGARYIQLLTEQYARPLGLEFEVVNDLTLLMRWRTGSQVPPVVFLGHADVVPVPEEERARWTHSPFSGAIDQGHVWGRGALDNKSSSICLLEAMASLKAAGLTPRRDIFLLVTPDEEVGGDQGAKLFVQDHLKKLDGASMVLDEGSFAIDDFLRGSVFAAVAVGEKHSLTVRAVVETPPGHASMPTRDDAPTVLTAALGRLMSAPPPPRLLAPLRLLLDRLAEPMPFSRRLILRNRWLFGGLIVRMLSRLAASSAMLRDTVALTLLRAGHKRNVIPARAEATLHLRLLPGTSTEEVLARIREAMAEPRVTLEVEQDGKDTPLAPVEGEDWERLDAALAAGLPGAVVAPIITPGTTDGRYFARAGLSVYRIIPYTLDAAERRRVHGEDERVSLSNLEQGITAYAHLLRYL